MDPDIKVFNAPKMNVFSFSLSYMYMFWVYKIDVSFTQPKHMFSEMFLLRTQNIWFYRLLSKYFINRQYSPNPLCPKFNLN